MGGQKMKFKEISHLARIIWDDEQSGLEHLEFLLQEVYFKDHKDGMKVETSADGKIVITPRVGYMRDAYDDFGDYLERNDRKEFIYNFQKDD